MDADEAVRGSNGTKVRFCWENIMLKEATAFFKLNLHILL